ncbi:MAG: Xaa-Pro peptidase family protein [Treponema sp.]|nr:Xaa-Pro peptidase family protein [Treponema sp.]
MNTLYNARREMARGMMKKAGIPALVLSPSSDLYYLSGCRFHLSERLVALVLTAEGTFLVYPRFEENYVGEDLRSCAECIPWDDGEDPFRIVTGFLPPSGGLCAAASSMPASFLLRLQKNAERFSLSWLDAVSIMKPLRMHKDEAEYALLKEAQERAGEALQDLYNWGLEKKSEEAVAGKLGALLREKGLERADWGPIVASGPNGASPHHSVSGRIIQRGDPVVIDFGGVWQGYQADMTRSPVAGKASQEYREVYEVVLSANEAAFRAARPGAACEDVDTAARELIAKAGYGRYFNHRLGHGIGLDIHEDPYMVAGNKTPLAPGMAFSDEPGIYLPGKFGIRTEDILFMGKNGAERLTSFPHDLQEI